MITLLLLLVAMFLVFVLGCWYGHRKGFDYCLDIHGEGMEADRENIESILEEAKRAREEARETLLTVRKLRGEFDEDFDQDIKLH